MLDLNPTHLETVTRILAAHVPECEVRAFGSRVTWTAKDYSDLDLAVVCDRALDPDVLRHMREAFETSDLPFRVDVLDWYAISVAFQKVIEKRYEVVQKGDRKNSGSAGEWRHVRLGDLVDEGILAISDGYRVRNEELGPEGIPFVRGGDIGDGWINTTTVDHIRPELASRVRAKLAGPDDVAFITKGTVGRAGRLRSGQPQVVFAPQVAYWRILDRDALDPRFAFYLVRSAAFQSALYGVKTHGAMVADYVSISQQLDFTLSIPGINSQRAIAHILGTLDDKIELNRRMNETLEAMARALFKSWFVDFDPVRARAEGRDPGLPKLLADLFPTSFEDSELGEIPRGWRVASVDDMCRRIAMGPFGSDIKTDNFIDFGVPVVRGSNLTDGFVEDSFAFVSETKADQLRNANAFPGDIVITHRGTLGQLGLIPVRSRFPRYVVSQSQMLLSVDHDVATPRYVYDFLRSPAGQHALLANTSQTGVPAIARPTSSVRAIRLILPPVKLLRQFEAMVAPLYGRRDRTISESRTLATLREALLPKLISGELRMPDTLCTGNHLESSHAEPDQSPTV